MPIYEYLCESCERRFTAMRSMSERTAPLRCEGCGSDRTVLALSVPARVGIATSDFNLGGSCARGIPGCPGGGCTA
jgi:putative FmdB family regulatory protein